MFDERHEILIIVFDDINRYWFYSLSYSDLIYDDFKFIIFDCVDLLVMIDDIVEFKSDGASA